MSTPAHSLPVLQPRAALFCKGIARVLLVAVMLLGFAGQILLTAASLPEESPRAAILRLTGLDIAPSSMPAAMQIDAQTTIAQGRNKNISRFGLAPSPARTTSHKPDQPAPSAQMTTGDIPTQKQATQPASTHPAQMGMAEDTSCPDHDALSSPQAVPPHTSPTATPGAENEQAGKIGTHNGMGHVSTVQNVAPIAGHTTAHSIHQVSHHHSHHHHGLDCPLCPLLSHVIFVLACLAALLSHERLTRRLWQDRTPSRAPPEPPYQHPPSRGPPRIIMTCIIA